MAQVTMAQSPKSTIAQIPLSLQLSGIQGGDCAMTKTRGQVGSVRGVPEPEATAVLEKVVAALAKEGTEFDRSRARELLEEQGIEGAILDGFLFSLQRTIPGIESTGDFGRYRIPEHWGVATRHRNWKFRGPTLNVLDALALQMILGEAGPGGTCMAPLTDGLRELIRRLDNALEPVR